MSTIVSLGDLLADLACAFPRQPIDLATLAVYTRELQDIPGDALIAAVTSMIRSSEWFPTIRAIREAAAEWALALPTESDALAQVEARVVWARLPDETRDADEMPYVHILVLEAIQHVGGFYSFRTAEKPAVVRGQFLKLYRQMRGDTLREMQVGRPALNP